MLKVYGSPLSSPTNKIRFLLDYLKVPYDFHEVSIKDGEHRKPEFLKINPFAKVPAIDDDGFTLAESNTIIRYLAEKNHSDTYPRDLKERAKVDQWLDYASLHIAMATAKIMFNTYFYKMTDVGLDERSLEDGKRFLDSYLPKVENQLNHTTYIAGNKFTIADISLLASLDVCEVIDLDLTVYPKINAWRTKLMSEGFYQKTHKNYAEALHKKLSAA